MITVIGKLGDLQKYRDYPGFNVMPLTPTWTPASNCAWLDEAIERGDKFLIVSSDYTGVFKNELIYLLQRITEHTP